MLRTFTKCFKQPSGWVVSRTLKLLRHSSNIVALANNDGEQNGANSKHLAVLNSHYGPQSVVAFE
jgi:hypothetical protein